MKRALAALVLLLTLAAGCARQPRPATAPAAAPPPKPGIGALRADLAAIFQSPAFSNAIWGVDVRSLATGERLYSRNATTLLMPASNMKVITAAVAAQRLGWAHTFETRLVSSAPVEGGVLKGDLVIVGSGDPSLGARPADAAAVLDAWAQQLAAKGITRIAGSVVGDDNAMPDLGLGRGWAWDDLGYSYATPAGAVSFAENVVQLAFKPGPLSGDPASIDASPAGHGLTIVNRVATGAAGSPVDLDFFRLPGSSTVTVSGTIPADRSDVTRFVSVDNPTAFTAGVVRAGLAARGVAVDGVALDIDEMAAPPASDGAATLASWTSPPLADTLKVLMKVSQNFYAESLLAAVGAGGPAGTRDSAGGLKACEETLAAWGLPADRFVQADGSGLSRYNFLTADVLVTVLERMYADPKHRAPFTDALPVAGVDGTLAGRMKDTKAAGNARAKTGSIANARSLSGYVTSADGEALVFSIIANHFNVPAAEATAVIDRAVVRLAEFRRR